MMVRNGRGLPAVLRSARAVYFHLPYLRLQLPNVTRDSKYRGYSRTTWHGMSCVDIKRSCVRELCVGCFFVSRGLGISFCIPEKKKSVC